MFNIVNGHAPTYLCSNVTMVHTQRSHSIRASIHSCIVPRANNAGQMAWNSLPTAIKILESKGLLKRQVKLILWNKVDT